jgi:hypothetical protein
MLWNVTGHRLQDANITTLQCARKNHLYTRNKIFPSIRSSPQIFAIPEKGKRRGSRTGRNRFVARNNWASTISMYGHGCCQAIHSTGQDPSRTRARARIEKNGHTSVQGVHVARPCLRCTIPSGRQFEPLPRAYQSQLICKCADIQPLQGIQKSWNRHVSRIWPSQEAPPFMAEGVSNDELASYSRLKDTAPPTA